MENHPIPQDVTGFKFRLIGSITVKQFLYLLGAGIAALIFYLLPIPIFIKIPAMFFPAIVGLALAFIPIDGRPMDKMISNFAKAIPSENQYIYHKKGVDMPYFYFNPAPQHVKSAIPQKTDSAVMDKALLFNSLSKSYFKPDEEEQKGIESLTSLFQDGVKENNGVGSKVIRADAPVQSPPPSLAPTVIPQEIIPQKEDAKPHLSTSSSKQSFAPAQVQPVPVPPAITPAVQAVTSAVPPLEKQATNPQSQKSAQSAAPAQTAPASGQNITPLTMDTASQFDSPNAIKGIIKDPRGKPLPHIIVEILDSNNIPQRTFRTNQNGVFAAATPMPNGSYTIHLEDTMKKQEFQDKTIKLDGSILPTIEIVSVDQREKLRRELFGVAPHA